MRSHITFRTVTQSLNDDAIKWNDLPRHWPFVRGIHLSHYNDANDAELWYLFWSAPEQMAEQTIETPAIWEAISLIMTSLIHPLIWDVWNGATDHTNDRLKYAIVWMNINVID